MKMLKRVGIFPVDQESITLFENIHECRYGEIMHIASIKAWGLCGKKIQRCDGSEIIIEEGIGNIIKECDRSVFSVPENPCGFFSLNE